MTGTPRGVPRPHAERGFPRPHAERGFPLLDALRAEWTKLRTSPGTFWSVVAIALATAGLSAFASGSVTCPCATDTTKLALSGVQLGQAVAAVFAVVIVGGEYGTGMITVTFAALPRRVDVLAAKALLVAGLVGVSAAAGVGGSWIAARAFLGEYYADDARPLVGSVLYLVLVALFALGVATLARASAPAIGTVLGVLYVAPIVALVVSDPDWKRHLRQLSPADAGLAVQATEKLNTLPIAPWAGLGVLAAWAAAALITAGVLLHTRDA